MVISIPLIEIERYERADLLSLTDLHLELELIDNKVQINVSDSILTQLRVKSKNGSFKVKLVRGKKAKASNKNKKG